METDADDDVDDDDVDDDDVDDDDVDDVDDDDVDDNDDAIVAVCHRQNGTSLDQSLKAQAQFYAGAK